MDTLKQLTNPLVCEDQDNHLAATRHQINGHVVAPRVLVVNDDHEISRQIKNGLSEKGYAINGAVPASVRDH